MDIADEFQQIRLLLTDNGFESVLEKVARSVVTVGECELRDKVDLTRRRAVFLRHLSVPLI